MDRCSQLQISLVKYKLIFFAGFRQGVAVVAKFRKIWTQIPVSLNAIW